ncbi:unnamed protein product [Zymoseptoria tritici ST99CH_1A5]|uniref:Uncharacterized protein n=1 Tax=Zymoseptoria tritici ST99CH_1A5 TaxID=1276529 RepID=A0A1Y6LVF8_ZYMTR|nr:unnamed protein product [Zymoseptoria tritici ST99CH_1A5]
MASTSHPTQTHPSAPPAALSKEDSTATTTSSTSTDFEVASPMKFTHTGDPLADRPSVQDAEPKLSRHISAIPDDGNEEDGKEKGLMAKLKAKLLGSKGKEHAHHEAPTRTSEDVEVVGTMSGSPVRDGGGLERHISAIPQD